MTSATRATLTLDILRDEGEVLHAYQDSLGFWTIGVGRLVDKRLGGGITIEESRMLLARDVSRVLVEMYDAFPWALGLSENRQRVLANLLFQLGLTRLKKFKATLAAMEWNAPESVEAGLRNSLLYKQAPARVERHISLWKQG
jgi:lysozyme